MMTISPSAGSLMMSSKEVPMIVSIWPISTPSCWGLRSTDSNGFGDRATPWQRTRNRSIRRMEWNAGNDSEVMTVKAIGQSQFHGGPTRAAATGGAKDLRGGDNATWAAWGLWFLKKNQASTTLAAFIYIAGACNMAMWLYHLMYAISQGTCLQGESNLGNPGISFSFPGNKRRVDGPREFKGPQRCIRYAYSCITWEPTWKLSKAPSRLLLHLDKRIWCQTRRRPVSQIRNFLIVPVRSAVYCTFFFAAFCGLRSGMPWEIWDSKFW